jgi:predicted NBD/HSP70 family sugar kinase
MTDLPASLRKRLAAATRIALPEVSRRYLSADGSVRYLLSLPGMPESAERGAAIRAARVETVFMPSERRQTICISTQAGCAVDCKFCLTAQLVARTVKKAGVKREQLAGVGVGLAGPIDLVTGRIHPSSIAPSWQFVDARKELEGLIKLPVYIDNDANLGALAEMTWGVGRGVSEAAYVKVDTGVGVGIVVAGQIYRGATGTAGEIGHTTVDENGPVCRCGNRGCLEGLVGTAALVESLRTRYRADLTMDDVLRSAADGDVGCRRALADAGRQLGVQVANLCNLLNPRLVIIAGKLSEADEIVLEPLRTTFARHALPHAVETVEVVRAALGERATALGGAALAMHESGALIDIGIGPYPVGRPRPTERRKASPSWGAV